MKTTEAALRSIGLCYLDKRIGLGGRRSEVLADGAVSRIEIFRELYFVRNVSCIDFLAQRFVPPLRRRRRKCCARWISLNAIA
jgi:hypothetical protein